MAASFDGEAASVATRLVNLARPDAVPAVTSPKPSRADLWMLLAVLTWGIYTVGLQRRPAGVDPMLLLAAFTLVGLLPPMPAQA